MQEKEKLVDLLETCLREEGLQILIGSESDFTQVHNFSIVARRYGTSSTPLGLVEVDHSLAERLRRFPFVGESPLAHKREQDNSARVLFPISIVSFNRLQNWELHDADSGIDLAHHVRSYFVPDFSGWQSPNAVGAELQKLVKALRKR